MAYSTAERKKNKKKEKEKETSDRGREGTGNADGTAGGQHLHLAAFVRKEGRELAGGCYFGQ